MLRSHRAGFPRVAPTAFVDDSAQVIGDVEIGEDSTNIQDGSVVHVMRNTHPTLIGDEVTVGHGAILHGCASRTAASSGSARSC